MQSLKCGMYFNIHDYLTLDWMLATVGLLGTYSTIDEVLIKINIIKFYHKQTGNQGNGIHPGQQHPIVLQS